MAPPAGSDLLLPEKRTSDIPLFIEVYQLDIPKNYLASPVIPSLRLRQGLPRFLPFLATSTILCWLLPKFYRCPFIDKFRDLCVVCVRYDISYYELSVFVIVDFFF